MYELVHKFSNFKVVQIIEFKDAEVNALGSNPILDFRLGDYSYSSILLFA